ncbi:zinc-binding dehydrogenase [Sphingomonas changnyeongensis]|uniref:Zinc-binding dehydrogenase n=1 Tax=Sphingomonas changnyeongensis TaxID=2698679 RepID=A0A7Z2NY32_9SPHN|nr:quinone oxidoreductase [Sphingomonas changnyeongensis]QHL91541.1 zinc-binding dehydrogenase [Sphingomonas changnyeongensis]
MAQTVMIERTGGPEVMALVDASLPPPGPGEVRMRNTAIGLNYIDTYHRSGLYPVELPGGLGMEAAGLVEAVGPGVEGLAAGDRVATFGPARGAYAAARNVPAASLFHVPDGIDDETAAAALLKGCTAEFLAERAAQVAPGDAVLVHAAAGGVGLILTQWLKALGATVIGTASSAAKCAAASAAGADHMLLADDPDAARQVRALTGGAGVRVSFDGVGAASWALSLAATGRRGLIISYGNASGPVSGVDLGVLARAGSLFVTRPTLFDYYAAPAERAAGVARLWDMILSGRVTVTIGQRYALADVVTAHRDLEARRTSGSTLLIP